MSVLRSVPTVLRFEWQRTLTLTRSVWWVLLTAFPPTLLGLMRYNFGLPPRPEPAELVVYILGPCVVCMLGVFLWATPWLSAELEGQSWVYLAVRPHGSVAVLLGKYLTAVGWTLPAGLIASALSSLIMSDSDSLHLVWVQSKLAALSSLAYAAVFVLIGAIFPKRAMVLGVFYAIVFEVVLSSVPAAVNLLTIQYRLRCLLAAWLSWEERVGNNEPIFQTYFGDASPAWHVTVLLLMTAGYLILAALMLRWREHMKAATDV